MKTKRPAPEQVVTVSETGLIGLPLRIVAAEINFKGASYIMLDGKRTKVVADRTGVEQA